ncbi:cadmium resistance transporter [Mycobacterium sp. 155]|uniref:cadmium resistance transporter n=1 Tax=Mycobacterium sp. 155 TaxID=1157943 RepID=UPI000376EC1D|nr:cadmium resistance transporter [Mycobacterium sp. 155]
MNIGTIGQAVGLFAVTNIDDIVTLALFFGQAVGRTSVVRVIIGQYLGFAAILAASVVGALGAGLLPETATAYLGLLPLALGLRAAWNVWREHRSRGADNTTPAKDLAEEHSSTGPGVMAVAAVTLANGGDNIGVYVPVFTTTSAGGLLAYSAVFLALVALWCVTGYFVARHPLVARALSRWGHILLPVVLISIGLIILIEGHALSL